MQTPLPLRDYQIAHLAFYIANQKCLDLSDPGVGKTPPVCVYQEYLWTHLGIKTAWVQPKSLMAKNRREILRFTNLKPEDVVIVDGTKKQVEEALKSNAKVFLMGFRRWVLSWRDLPADCRALMVDEAHRGIKNPESSTSQSMFDAFRSGRFEYFLAMTGTLISGKLESAYPAIHIIEPRYYLSYKDFLNQHAIYDYEGEIIGWKNHGKLTRVLSTHGVRRTFKDVFGEQEIVHQVEIAALTPKQREVYEKFEEEAVLELEKFFIDGTQPGVAFLRARQLLEHPNHFPDLTNPGQYVDIMPGEAPGKELLLEEHLLDHRDTGEPLLIFSPLVPQQQRIMKLLEKLKIKSGLINGSVSMQDRDDLDQAFQRGDIQCIVGSPACMDVGFNLQWSGKRETGHVIFMTPEYLDSSLNQAIGRAVRGQRQSPLRVTFFRYPDTVDDRVFQIVEQKSVDAHLVDSERKLWQFDRD